LYRTQGVRKLFRSAFIQAEYFLDCLIYAQGTNRRSLIRFFMAPPFLLNLHPERIENGGT
ncbi:MAG: hypothetical protein ACREMY_15375, partial [bacterium]